MIDTAWVLSGTRQLVHQKLPPLPDDESQRIRSSYIVREGPQATGTLFLSTQELLQYPTDVNTFDCLKLAAAVTHG